jgi:hypothetical protein
MLLVRVMTSNKVFIYANLSDSASNPHNDNHQSVFFDYPSSADTGSHVVGVGPKYSVRIDIEPPDNHVERSVF